ncbi:MAG: ATP-dependent Clp protease adaptor protein ClpS [Flavobacteriaceae bacterium]|nr:MAG: ATP-dependent Clp protease adaptor protein ClpS [Flavobacteriaceae bacterium]
MVMSVKEKTKKDQGQSLSKSDYHEIILYNDDINTFDHVIDILIKVCDHSATQAEQCALIVHYKGKCSVKSGTLFDLKPRVKKMIEANLTAEII